jgi:hypothetical protein
MVQGPEALITFSFDYGSESRAIRTLFTKEMLARGFLAGGSVYVSYAHKSAAVEKYLRAADAVFAILARAIEKKTVHALLGGEVAHQGFERLT